MYDVSGDNFSFSPQFQPIPCTGTVTANCLPAGEVGSWNSLYSQVAGLVSASSVVATRTGADLTANAPGTPVRSFVEDRTWNVFFTDASGNPISAETYLNARLGAAEAGQVYNPTLGFTPIGAAKGNLVYPYKPYFGEVAPRVAIAWNPDPKGGWLSKLLGDKATVISVGYGRAFSRNLGIDLVSTPVLGDGFLQPVTGDNPNSNYNAGFASVQKRTSNFNLIGNFTWSKALGIIGLNQAYTENNVNNPWNLGADYGS